MRKTLTEEEIRRTFAQQVDLFSSSDSPFGRHATMAWLDPFEATMIVLDVACGAGHAAEQIAPRVRQVVGLDLTPDLLAVGDDRLRDAGLTNVLFMEGNAAALPFVDASFDIVFCRSALHHFSNPRANVREMARVCRSQGRVVVMDMVAPSAEVRGAFDDLHRLIDPSHMEVLLGEEMVALLASEVGPVCHAEVVGPSRLPIDQILTDASDRESVQAALARELQGQGTSGFAPELEHPSYPDSKRLAVSFTSVTVHAVKAVP